MDLGLSYTASEKAFYTHSLIQSFAIFCIAYKIVDNLYLSLILLGVWLFIKNFDHLNKLRLKVQNTD